MNTPIETETGYVSDFLRGFADGAGITVGLAREYWEGQARKLRLTCHDREDVESTGYTGGQAQAERWQKQKNRRNLGFFLIPMKPTSVTRKTPALGMALLLGLTPLAVKAATTNVSFGGFFFNPKIVTIFEGDTVVWTIAPGQIANHTVTGPASEPICGPGIVGSGCQHIFTTAGTFPYMCATIGHAAAGMTGVVQVVRAPPAPALLTNLVRLPDGQLRFTVRTTANRTNVVQASTNPAPSNWIPIGIVVPGSNSFVFTDTNTAGLQLRFYRVVEP